MLFRSERLHDLGVVFIQQQRDRQKDILKRAREDSGASKRELKRRYEQYKAASEKASESDTTPDSDDESCKSSFEEMMEIGRIIQAKWEKISTLMK